MEADWYDDGLVRAVLDTSALDHFFPPRSPWGSFRFSDVRGEGKTPWKGGVPTKRSRRTLMAYLHEIMVGHLDTILYAFSLLVGALPKGLGMLQRRGFRRGFGRRRRRGGIFGALGMLVLFLVVGPIVILALVAYAIYGALRGRRRR